METLAQDLFLQALELDRAGRDAFLARSCGGNAELRLEVERMLEDARRADSFLAAADGATLSPNEFQDAYAEKEGDQVGPYKLRQQIGEGGFGVVWMAEQSQPISRMVALKVVKAGMDTRQVLARFEAERQALAMMDHSNIAHVLDAGATASGRPYFAMELVRGIPITQFCDEAGLGTKERLALFRDVCSAINHAHQKGVIHRDIKPSNVMVTLHGDKAVVKVIDFGIAKATQGKLTEQTLFTRFEQFIGTPVYMSPEQAALSGLDIDTRSDIYSLGVLLYELLTGKPPFDAKSLASAGYEEMRRIIREVEPPKPSSRLGTIVGDERTQLARAHRIDPEKLNRLVEPDLDWIVMKAIDKDRTRRYATADGLALDLQRHLDHEVVIARPPTKGYLLGRLVRRNKLAFAAAGAIAASLVIGIAASVWQALRATSAEHRAVATLDELRATAPAFAEQARALAAKEAFGEAVEKLDYALQLRPGEPEYLMAKGDLLQCQLKLAEAAAVYREALATTPGLVRAGDSARLCDELLAAPPDAAGGLTRENLAKLHLAMQRQQRSAAELMPVARRLGEERKLIVGYWLERLKQLPVSSEPALDQRLVLRDDGRLLLDLSGTQVSDLSALAGAPIAFLDLSQCKELSDLAPIRGLDLAGLKITGSGVTDLSPLREMHRLETLYLSNTLVSDLSPLSALRLKVLDLMGCPVRDLEPVRAMPLTEINLRESRVANLSPLVGMAITEIDLTGTPVLDFSPLAGLPLERCFLQSNRITDLAVLRGKPLRELVLWNCSEARNYEAITGIETLELLLLPSQYRTLPDEDLAAIRSLRDHPRLRQIGSEIMNRMGYAATGSKEAFWQDWDREQAIVTGLRSRKVDFSLEKLPAGSYRLEILSSPVGDLGIFASAPISELVLRGCQISDLTPLRDLPLESLDLAGNPVIDLSPLEGMQITKLNLSRTGIRDLSPLTGLPLRELYLDGCESVADVSSLAGMPTLLKVTVPIRARKIEALRSLAGLTMLSFQLTTGAPYLPDTTSDVFWKRWPDLSWARLLADREIDYQATQFADGAWSVTVLEPGFRDLSVFEGGKIRELTLDHTSVTDLAPLAGLPLELLDLDSTPVSDLTPLGDIALKSLSLRETKVTDLSVLRRPPLCKSLTGLWLYRTKITDFSPVAACTELTVFDATETALADLEPLRGRKLREIYFSSTGLRDISILAGMPLERAFFDQTAVSDLKPLLECRKLRDLILPISAGNTEVLHDLPSLDRISFHYDPQSGPSMTAVEFWKTHDKDELLGRVDALLEEGKVDAAILLLAEASSARADDTLLTLKLAALLAWTGRDAERVATNARMLKWAAGTNIAFDAERVAKLVSLRPASDRAQREAALALARRGVELGQGNGDLVWFHLARGMAAYRSEEFAEAEEALAAASHPRVLANLDQNPVLPTIGFYRAMCHFKQGKPAEAREFFAAARSKMKPLPATDRFPMLAGNGHDDLIAWLAHNEAESLMEMPAPD